MAANKLKLIECYALNPRGQDGDENRLTIGLDSGKNIRNHERFIYRLEKDAAELLRQRTSKQALEVQKVQQTLHKEHLSRIDAIFADPREKSDTPSRRHRAKKAFLQGAAIAEVRALLREGKRPVESIHESIRKLKAYRQRLMYHVAEEMRSNEHAKMEKKR